jgi:hypothetical protein
VTTAIILPAARDHDRAQLIVDQIIGLNDGDISVFVISPGFNIEFANNIHDDMIGSSRAIAHAIKSIGPDFERIGWLSDICIPQSHCIDNMIEFVDARSVPFIAEFRTTPYTPGLYRVCTIKGNQYARWGMMSRRSIDACGFFDPMYENYYGDVDLSLRCWKIGGSVATCINAVIEMRGHSHPNMAPKSADETAFLKRWSGDYTAMVTEHTSMWNVDREMNIG